MPSSSLGPKKVVSNHQVNQRFNALMARIDANPGLEVRALQEGQCSAACYDGCLHVNGVWSDFLFLLSSDSYIVAIGPCLFQQLSMSAQCTVPLN